MIDNEYPYVVRFDKYNDAYWKFCSERLHCSSWKMMFPIIGASCSVCFKNEEDLLAFRLMFGAEIGRNLQNKRE